MIVTNDLKINDEMKGAPPETNDASKKVREISHFDEQTPFLNAFINGIVGTRAGMLSGHF